MRPRSYERYARRYRLIITVGVFGFISVFFVIFLCLRLISESQPLPLSVVVASDPVTLYFFDKNRANATIVTMPSQTRTGDGSYSLEALWNLGNLDPKDSHKLSSTLSDVFGVPVRWYIGPARDQDPVDEIRFTKENPLGILTSSGMMFAILRGAVRTNTSIISYIPFAMSIRAITPDHITVTDVTKTTALLSQKLADESSVQVLDTSRIDAIFSRSFEDASIRSESMSVAIYNTTSIPSLGSSVARLLSHIGIVVAVVGNESTQIQGCTLSGSRSALQSVTAKFIHSVYTCQDKEDTNALRADLILRLGKEFRKGE